ncbi:hypothetical protein Celaphus_00007221 [Cervus elaphus hippelaphus]|uniref:Uncharacterized protein n=1 Tax=Cervus elaphus hippelaphus TaxID=46360 RepID=A0A212CYE3_CEREH|nr:hypothetical protein Celaphus_00007221 [Cervus elaphus hippelaphus]
MGIGSMTFLSSYVKAYPPGNQKSSSEKRLMNGEIDEPHPTLAYRLPKEMAELAPCPAPPAKMLTLIGQRGLRAPPRARLGSASFQRAETAQT